MILLKPILPCHKELLFNWRNDPDIFYWCRQNDLLDWNTHCAWFDKLGLDKSIKMYLIETENKIPIGVCGLTDIDLINQRAEFSLYIAKEFQSRGYGKLALITLIKNSFDGYPLNNIWGESFENNPAIEMFKKLGLKLEGIREEFYFKNGKFIDAHLFSIKRYDYDRIALINNSHTA